MKTKKLIVGLLSTSTILGISPMISSCSTQPTIEIDEDYPKETVTGPTAKRVYFYFNQKNITKAESTTLELVNLYAGESSIETPVSGLWTWSAGESGVIQAAFNMELATQTYGADEYKFDVKFSNAQTNFEQIITGFKITIDVTTTTSIDYQATNGITFSSKPQSITIGADLDVAFQLSRGFIWNNDVCDIKINGQSQKQATFIQFKLDEGYIHVPGEYIRNNSSITVTLAAKGETYSVSSQHDEKQVVLGKLTEITHDTEGNVEIDCRANDYYEITKTEVKDVDGNDIEGVLVENNKLKIPKANVFSDISIVVTSQVKKYDIEVQEDHGYRGFIKFTCDEKKVNHDSDFTGKLTVVEEGWTLSNPFNAAIKDEATGRYETTPITLGDDGSFTISKDLIKGPVVLKPYVTSNTYNVDTTTLTTENVTIEGPDKVSHNASNYTFEVKATDAYHSFDASTDEWNCYMGSSTGTSIKSRFSTSGNKLTIQGFDVTGDLYFTAKAGFNSWEVAVDRSEASHITTTTITDLAKYNEEFTTELDIDDDQYEFSVTSATCQDAADPEATPTSILDKVHLDKKENENKLILTIDAAAIKGKISLKFGQTANQYDVVKPTDSHISFTGPDKITHNDTNNYNATVSTDDLTQFKVNPDTLIVTQASGHTLTKGTDYKFTAQTSDKFIYNLWIDCSKIDSKPTIYVESTTATFDITASKDDGITSISPTSGTATHGVDFEISYVMEAGKKIDETNTQCVMTHPTTGVETVLKIGEGITNDTTNNKLIINGSDIKGKLVFSAKSTDILYTVSCSATGLSIKGTAPTPKYHAHVEIPLTIADNYIFNVNDFSNGNVIVKTGDKALTYNTDYYVYETEGNEMIDILNDKVEGNITIIGELTKYNVISSQTTGFDTIPDTFTINKNTTFTATATLTEGYGNPVVTIKCGDTTLTLDDDYTVTTSGSTVTVSVTNTAKILGPMTMNFNASITSIVVSGSHEIDVDSDTTTTLTANTDVTWAITEGSDLISLSATTGSSVNVTVQDGAKTTGGYATITCTASGLTSATFKLVLDTASKLTYDTSTTGVAIVSGNEASGKVIIPGEYYDQTQGWIPTQIGSYGFSSTYLITSLTMLEGIKTIGSYAFNQQIQIPSISIPASVTSIDEAAFGGDSTNSVTTSLTFASGSLLTEIGEGAFAGQAQISSVTLPDQLQTIGGRAFQSWKSLTQITIPANVTNIGDQAFYDSTNLKTIYVDSETIALETDSTTVNSWFLYWYALLTGNVYVLTDIATKEEFASSYIATHLTKNRGTVGNYTWFTYK